MKQRFSTNNSTKPMEFGEIDFEEIEWRSEYSYLPDVFGGSLLVQLLYRCVVYLGQPKWLAYMILSLPVILFLALRQLKHKSTLILTGHSVLLKRPRLPYGIKLLGRGWLFEDIEIPYADLGEIEVQRELHETSRYQLYRGIKRKVVAVTIYSQGLHKRIAVNDKLINLPGFVKELERRKQKALERYQGYAKGTSLRQPGRSVEIQSAQQEQKVERLLEEKVRVERLQQRLKS
jgi:hypothetical protein